MQTGPRPEEGDGQYGYEREAEEEKLDKYRHANM